MYFPRFYAVATTAAFLSLTGLVGCSSSGPAAPSAAAPAPNNGEARLAADEIAAQPASASRVKPSLRYALAYPTGNQATSVILLEADSPDQVHVGQGFEYTLRVTNLSDFPLQSVHVRDIAVGTGTAMTSRGTTRPAREDPIAWDIGYLGPKQTLTKQISGVADEPGSIHNCIAVSYSPTLCTSIRVVKPELALTKEGPESAMICQDITWVYSVTNTGTGNATNVRVVDALPEGLTTTEGAREVSQTIDTLAQGQSRQFSTRLKATHTGTFTSRATARSGEVESQSRSVSTIVSAPALAISVDGPESRYVNEPVDYRVTVRNTGDAASANTIVHLTSSTGEALSDHSVGVIEPNDSRSFVVTTRSGNAGGTMKLTATATGTCVQQPATSEASVAIVTIPALRLGVVHSVDPVRVGGNTVYTISVANTGSGADKDAIVSATLPPEEQFVSGGGTTSVTAAGSNLTFGTIPTMNPGDTATWNVEVKTVKDGDAVFHATLKSASMTKAAEKVEPTRIVP